MSPKRQRGCGCGLAAARRARPGQGAEIGLLAIQLYGAQYSGGVLARQGAFTGVVASALGTENEKAVRPRPVIDCKSVATGRVRHSVRNGLSLRRGRGNSAKKC